MAGSVSLLLCLLARLAGAWAARIAYEQQEEWPWRKAVAVGTILGSTLSGKAVATWPKSASGEADLDAIPQGELYDRVGQAFVEFLEPHQLQDGSVVDKLMKSLSSSTGERDGEFIKDIAASLQGGLHREPEVSNVICKDSGVTAIQQIFFKDRKGERGVIVGRYLSDYWTTMDKKVVLDMVRSMELSTSLDVGVFLRCVAQSHTADELERDEGAEFMVMLEPFAGALREFVLENDVDYVHRFGAFLDTFAAVERLYQLNIPHTSNLNPDTVLAKRVPTDHKALKIVLSPAILEGRASAGTAQERFEADVKELGSLLHWFFDLNWPAQVRQRTDVINAFAKALSSGAISSLLAAQKELTTVAFSVFADDVTSEELLAARMRFLKLAMSAVKSGESA